MQAVGSGLHGLAALISDDSALEVCIHETRYTNRRLYLTLPHSVYPKMVTHFSANLVQCRVTSLMHPMTLPLSQTTTTKTKAER